MIISVRRHSHLTTQSVAVIIKYCERNPENPFATKRSSILCTISFLERIGWFREWNCFCRSESRDRRLLIGKFHKCNLTWSEWPNQLWFIQIVHEKPITPIQPTQFFDSSIPLFNTPIKRYCITSNLFGWKEHVVPNYGCYYIFSLTFNVNSRCIQLAKHVSLNSIPIEDEYIFDVRHKKKTKIKQTKGKETSIIHQNVELIMDI